MNYFAIFCWSTVLIFIGIIIYGFIKWRKLPTSLKGGLIGITSYWFLFFLAFILIFVFKVDPNALYIISVRFYSIALFFNVSEMFYLVGSIFFIGSPLIFALVGILIGLSVSKFKKRSSSQAKRPNQATGSNIVR
jgi:hypothetical protein